MHDADASDGPRRVHSYCSRVAVNFEEYNIKREKIPKLYYLPSLFVYNLSGNFFRMSMCCCISGEPVEDPSGRLKTKDTSKKFQVGMMDAPCVDGWKSWGW